jgi:hypothetical protein
VIAQFVIASRPAWSFSSFKNARACHSARLAVVFRDDRPPFPATLDVERLPGGFKVIDANGQSLAYFYARENDHDANTAGVLTMDEARRMAINFARLPELLTR